VTPEAVQVPGGFGYTKQVRVERHMREAKVTQIFEGTNPIQRLVIAGHLARSRGQEKRAEMQINDSIAAGSTRRRCAFPDSDMCYPYRL
jgi:hypothetical protein